MLFQKQAGIALIDNLTLVYDYARLTAIDDVLYIVAGDDEADAIFSMTEIDEFSKLTARNDIEPRGGFIQKHNLRQMDEAVDQFHLRSLSQTHVARGLIELIAHIQCCGKGAQALLKFFFAIVINIAR